MDQLHPPLIRRPLDNASSVGTRMARQRNLVCTAMQRITTAQSAENSSTSTKQQRQKGTAKKSTQFLFSQCAIMGSRPLSLCCEATNYLVQIDQIKHPTQEEEARLRMNRPSPFPSSCEMPQSKCAGTNNNSSEKRIGGPMIFNQQSARRPNKSRGGAKGEEQASFGIPSDVGC